MNKENIVRRLCDALSEVRPEQTLPDAKWGELHELHYEAVDVINRQKEQIRKLTGQVEKALETMRITGDLAERQLRVLSDAKYHFPEMKKFDIEDLRDRVREAERENESENEDEDAPVWPRP